jgi:DNA-binding IscR family transcriptional regulator
MDLSRGLGDVYKRQGQCVLLAIWKHTGDHMREHLAGFTLANVADAANGKSSWPETNHHD